MRVSLFFFSIFKDHAAQNVFSTLKTSIKNPPSVPYWHGDWVGPRDELLSIWVLFKVSLKNSRIIIIAKYPELAQKMHRV